MITTKHKLIVPQANGINEHSDDDSYGSEDELFSRLEKNAQKRKKKLTCCYCFWFTMLACVILLLLSLVLYQQYAEAQMCLRPQCVENAGSVLSKMNLSVDPCEDFYEYACGKWLAQQVIPPDKSQYDMFTKVGDANTQIIQKLLVNKPKVRAQAIENAMLYYKDCLDMSTINKRGIQPLLKLIKELGSWTVTNDNISGTWKKSTWDLTTVLSKILSYGSNAFIGLSLSRDDKNTSQHIMEFTQSGLTLSSRNEYLKNETKFKEGFLSFSIAIAKLLGADEKRAEEKMTEVYEFEKKLAEIFIPKEKLVDREKTYNKIKLEELQNILKDQVDLVRLIKDGINETVSLQTEILLPVTNYYKNLSILLKNTDKEILANYMMWAFIQGMTSYLSSNFIQASLLLDSVETGIDDVGPRWRRCVRKTSSVFGFAVSSLYVSEKFSKESRAEVEEILNNIKLALNDRINELNWMDEQTKSQAIDKANAVFNMIGYPDWILDPTALDEYFSGISLVEGEFFENYLKMRKFLLAKQIEKFHKTPDPKEWSMFPYEVNAYYSPDDNKIVFPAGILQPPFYDVNMPRSVKYGSLGMIIGHELTHGFDSEGRKFDKHGNLNNWWSEESAKRFETRAKCIVEKYEKYSIDGTQLNGLYTLTENIADNAGLKLGYEAYVISNPNEVKTLPGLDLSPQQQFFLGFAQTWCSTYRPEIEQMNILTDSHSIKRFRVIGSVSNLQEFSEAFNCKIKSPMNPDKKCSVW